MRIKLELTKAEAEALVALAEEGAEGLFMDEAASKAYLGGWRGVNAGTRALEKLHSALAALPRQTREVQLRQRALRKWPLSP